MNTGNPTPPPGRNLPLAPRLPPLPPTPAAASMWTRPAPRRSWAGSWSPTPTGRCRGWSVRPGKASWPRCLPDGTARACGGSGTPGDGKSWHPGTNPWKRLPRASWRPGRARRTCCTSPGKAGRPRLLRRRMPSSPSRKRAAGASGMPISGRCWLRCTGKYGGISAKGSPLWSMPRANPWPSIPRAGSCLPPPMTGCSPSRMAWRKPGARSVPSTGPLWPAQPWERLSGTTVCICRTSP